MIIGGITEEVHAEYQNIRSLPKSDSSEKGHKKEVCVRIFATQRSVLESMESLDNVRSVDAHPVLRSPL